MTNISERDDRSDMDDDSIDLWSIETARAALDAYDAARWEIETLVRAAAMTFAGKVQVADPDFVDLYEVEMRDYSANIESAANAFVTQVLSDLDLSITNYINHGALANARDLADRDAP